MQTKIRTIYIANDETEFSTETEALRHDEDLKLARYLFTHNDIPPVLDERGCLEIAKIVSNYHS